MAVAHEVVELALVEADRLHHAADGRGSVVAAGVEGVDHRLQRRVRGGDTLEHVERETLDILHRVIHGAEVQLLMGPARKYYFF